VMAAAFLAILIGLPPIAAFTYSYGEVKTVYPHCVNATSGALLGTNANITVRNESGGVYDQNLSITNMDTGIFSYTIHNLSDNHCYAFTLGCEDAGTWQTEWATVCVNSSVTTTTVAQLGAGFADFSAVFGMSFGAALFAFMAWALGKKWKVAHYFFIPLSTFFLFLTANAALQGAEAAGASSGVISTLQTNMWVAVMIIIATVTTVVIAGLWMALKMLGEHNTKGLGGRL